MIVVCEKHGLAGVLRQATEPWRVPLATLGGTYSHSLAGDLIEWIATYGDRPVYIFYFGDYDPTGILIPKWLHRDMYAIAPHKVADYDCDHYVKQVRIVRLAVNNLGQAQQFGGVTTRLTKTKDNTHVIEAEWPPDQDSVEVDSIPPGQLQAMVAGAIEGLIDKDRWARSCEAEERERAKLRRRARRF